MLRGKFCGQFGQVRVEDAKGQPPSIPSGWRSSRRTTELSGAVSELREEIEELLRRNTTEEALASWLVDQLDSDKGARQLASYLVRLQGARRYPSKQTLVMERFFDESGGCNWDSFSVWVRIIGPGIGLRKRFCGHSIQLQAARRMTQSCFRSARSILSPRRCVRYLNSKSSVTF